MAIGSRAPSLRPGMSGRNSDSSDVIIRELTVLNRLGIHARPAALFVRTAGRFQCEISIEKDGERVNGKSIMGLMMLAAGPGSRIRIEVSGSDAEAALLAIEDLISVRKFDED